MRKLILLVVLFLGGMTTQTMTAHHKDGIYKPGKKHRYYNSQSVAFVENGVLFTVFRNGTFDYKFLRRPFGPRRGNSNQNVYYNNSAPGEVHYVRGRRHYNRYVTYDRFGRLRSIGNTLITYKRNGKVKFIGSVPLYYHRGRLVGVGNMEVVYDRFGNIRLCNGYVNRYNRRVWHDDWYNDNDYDDNWDDWDDDWDDDDWDDRPPRRRNRNQDD